MSAVEKLLAEWEHEAESYKGSIGQGLRSMAVDLRAALQADGCDAGERWDVLVDDYSVIHPDPTDLPNGKYDLVLRIDQRDRRPRIGMPSEGTEWVRPLVATLNAEELRAFREALARRPAPVEEEAP